MLQHVTHLASTEAATEKAGLFEALGIDWKMFILQSIAFLVLLWLLSKFVYPVITKSIDDREDKLAEGQKAATAAAEKAAKAEAEIKKLLSAAKKDASDIIVTAKDEASATVAAADEKAKSRAERIVADAHDQLQKDILEARKVLHNETIELVAQATEKVVGSTVNKSVDEKLIAKAVKELS